MLSKLVALLLATTFSIQITKGWADGMDVYYQKLTQHPQIEQAVSESQMYESLAAGEWGLPDPQVIIGFDNVPINDPAFDTYLPTSKVLGVKQTITSTTLRRSKAERQQGLAKRQKLSADYQLAQLKALLISQLHNLNRVKQQETLSGQQIDMYTELEQDLQGQLEAGQPIYGRFSELDIERVDIEQYLNELKAQRITIESSLIQLVGEVPNLPPPKVRAKPWQPQSSELYALKIASQQVSVTSSAIKVAEAAFKPTFGLQALYKQREAGDNFEGDDWFSVQASVSIPIWSKRNQTPKLQAAQSKQRSAQLAYSNLQRRWQERLTMLQAQRQAVAANVQLLKNKRDALKQRIEATERNYESGKSDLAAVLYSQIDGLTLAAKIIGQESRYQILTAKFNSHIVGDKNEYN